MKYRLMTSIKEPSFYWIECKSALEDLSAPWAYLKGGSKEAMEELATKLESGENLDTVVREFNSPST